jgi:hypothetical protein
MTAELEPIPGSNVITAMPSSSNSEIRPNSRLDHLVTLDIPTLENFRASTEHSRGTGETSSVPSGFFEHGEQELEKFCRLNGLDVEDKRTKGGRLWIYHYANDDEVASQLRNWGFLFVPDKGYWHR